MTCRLHGRAGRYSVNDTLH